MHASVAMISVKWLGVAFIRRSPVRWAASSDISFKTQQYRERFVSTTSFHNALEVIPTLQRFDAMVTSHSRRYIYRMKMRKPTEPTQTKRNRRTRKLSCKLVQSISTMSPPVTRRLRISFSSQIDDQKAKCKNL